MDSEHKPRARRRDDREQERREKLQSVPTSAPRKFTLDDPAPVTPASAASPARPSGRGRYERGERSTPERGGEGATFGGQPMNGARGNSRPAAPSGNVGGGRPRRVITLERPRNEHLRPVNITVQRMYFGDWTLDHMPPEETQGGRSSGGRSFERGGGSERASSERGGRGYTRGGNDRGAVQRVNGRQQSTPRPQQAAAPQAQAAAPAQAASVQSAQAQAAQADDAKRRRRRRGRRGGNGGPASG